LKEAIEILEDYLRGDEPDYNPDLPAALRLAIEDLKRTVDWRNRGMTLACFLLDGETVELKRR